MLQRPDGFRASFAFHVLRHLGLRDSLIHLHATPVSLDRRTKVRADRVKRIMVRFARALTHRRSVLLLPHRVPGPHRTSCPTPAPRAPPEILLEVSDSTIT